MKTKKKYPRILVCSNTAWSLLNFRSGLIKFLIANSFEVVAVAPNDEYADSIRDLGCSFEPIPINGRGTNPLHDLLLTWRFWLLLRRVCPDVYLGYTIKPNIYGSLAAHSLGIPVINNIAGLGTIFTKSTLLTFFVRCLYKCALIKSEKVFFQNEDDRTLLVSSGVVDKDITDCLPGSGVDLEWFKPQYSSVVFSENRSFVRFLLIARMLWEKGVGIYVEAARLVRQKYPNIKFELLGFVDGKNPDAVSLKQIMDWDREGVVAYLGDTQDVRFYISRADCVVLPSYYREGVPRSLLEAAAMGVPIITTDSVGCREVVEDGVNGYLCLPKSPDDLALKMEKMILLHEEDRRNMGRQARRRMAERFDEGIVMNRYLKAIQKITGS